MKSNDEEFVRRIRDQAERVRRGRESTFWRDLGSVGALGWMIVAPTVVGAWLGRRLDRHFHAGLFWTLTLLLIGTAAGCLSAWRHGRREIDR